MTKNAKRIGVNGQLYTLDEYGNPTHAYIESSDGDTWSERHTMGCAICGESENAHY